MAGTRQAALNSGSKLVVVGLAILIGLSPPSGGETSGRLPSTDLTRRPMETATPDVGRAVQTDYAVSQPKGAAAGWWATVQEDIGRSEYQATWQDHTQLPDVPAAHQAPNRAHNIRTYFTSAGIRVVPRTGGADWEWGLRLTGYGYEGAIQPLASGSLTADGNRVEYHRSALTEWYINDEHGLEQGFTIGAPPGGTSMEFGAGLLVLEMTMNGDLTPTLFDDGQAVELITKGGVRVLRYGSLYAEDAAGHRLPAHLTVGPKGISVLIDDTSAIYPIVVDPLVTSPSWTAESDQASAEFGFSVGTAGDVNGDAYSDVIVGAVAYDIGEFNEGKVFVYHGSAMGLSATADWTAEGNQTAAHFGYSVSTAGDVNGDGYSDAIVGAYQYENGQPLEGRAFVYHGSATGLNATVAWTAEGNLDFVRFGRFVGTAGDVNSDGYSDVIVGAPLYDNGEDNEGRAFVYHGSATGLSATADWTAEGNQTQVYFGHSVGTAGDVNRDGYHDVIVGAYGYANGQTEEGRAFVYHGSAAGLSASANWTAESNQANARFGYSVSTAGDVNGDGYADVIVGAYLYDRFKGEEGGAFVYRGSANGLTVAATWSAVSDQATAFFGVSVSTAGDVNGDGNSDVIVGAYRYDNGQTDEGRAFVYLGSATALSGGADWTAESDQASAQFGWSVETAGDVNGDGYSDVIVGAYLFDNGETDEGRTFVFHGSPTGLSATAAWTAESDQATALFGYSVGTAGDVNDDGYSDVIVGAITYDSGENNEGRAFVYHGSATGLSATADWTAESNQANAKFGYSVGAAGDVNGDGYSDVIVGAVTYNIGEIDAGRAFVYHGSMAGLSDTANWTAEGDQAEAWFGWSVSTAGDVNGDGYSDVIVGAVGYDNVAFNDGRVFVYHGSAVGLSATAGWTAEGDHSNDAFGGSVRMAGDVNADGYSDVIVGAEGYAAPLSGQGRAYVYHGSPIGLSATADWTAEGGRAQSSFGYSVGAAGDVNGDGYSDVIVGAYRYDNEGRAFVYHGSATALSATADWTAESDQASAWFGFSVGTAGDVNGDGYSDVVVGANHYDSGENGEGRASVFLGSATESSNLLVTKSASPDPATAGSNLTYTLEVTNAGPSDATGVALTDVLPLDLTHFTSTPTQGLCDESAGTVNCDLGVLASGSTSTIVIQVVVNSSASSTVANTVSVTSNEIDYVLVDNTNTAATTIQRIADLEVTSHAVPNPVVVNGDITYTVVVANNGPSDSTDVVMTTGLPAGVTFISSTPGSPTCADTGSSVTCIVGLLVSGASTTTVFKFKVVPTSTAFVLENTASVTGMEFDPNSLNNSHEQFTFVFPYAGFPGLSHWALIGLAVLLGAAVYLRLERRSRTAVILD